MSWNYYTDSFIDSGNLPLTEKRPLANKTWVYENRDLVSELVSNILDGWVTNYFRNKIGDDDYTFRNDAANLFMPVDYFRDLLYCENELGPEV